MTNQALVAELREAICNHRPIVGLAVPEYPGDVLIRTEVFEALIKIAHDEIHPNSDGQVQSADQTNGLLKAIFGGNSTPFGGDDDDDDETAEQGNDPYDDLQIRNLALQVSMNFGISVQNRRDALDPVFDIIELAESARNFLAGGSKA